jgi:hypothetical protein
MRATYKIRRYEFEGEPRVELIIELVVGQPDLERDGSADLQRLVGQLSATAIVAGKHAADAARARTPRRPPIDPPTVRSIW